MSVDEGLTGMVIEKLEPVMAVDAMAHPRYKYFPETGEERYHSFLGVPIARARHAARRAGRADAAAPAFSRHEVRLLRAIAAQVGGVLVQARLLEDLRSKEKERREYRRRMVAAIKRLHGVREPDRASETSPRRKRRERPPERPAGRARLRSRARAPAAARGQLRAASRTAEPTTWPASACASSARWRESVARDGAPEGAARAPAAGVRRARSSTRTA